MKDVMCVNLNDFRMEETLSFSKEYGINFKNVLKPSLKQIFGCIEERWESIEKQFKLALLSNPIPILNFDEFAILLHNRRNYEGKTFEEIPLKEWLDESSDFDTDDDIVNFVVEKTFYVDNVLYQSIVELDKGLVLLWQPELQNISFGKALVGLDSVIFFSDYYRLRPDNVFIKLPKGYEL